MGNTLKRHYETYNLEYELAHDDVDGECYLLSLSLYMCVVVYCMHAYKTECLTKQFEFAWYNSSAAGDWVNCGICGEWAHFGCDRQ